MGGDPIQTPTSEATMKDTPAPPAAPVHASDIGICDIGILNQVVSESLAKTSLTEMVLSKKMGSSHQYSIPSSEDTMVKNSPFVQYDDLPPLEDINDYDDMPSLEDLNDKEKDQTRATPVTTIPVDKKASESIKRDDGYQNIQNANEYLNIQNIKRITMEHPSDSDLTKASINAALAKEMMFYKKHFDNMTVLMSSYENISIDTDNKEKENKDNKHNKDKDKDNGNTLGTTATGMAKKQQLFTYTSGNRAKTSGTKQALLTAVEKALEKEKNPHKEDDDDEDDDNDDIARGITENIQSFLGPTVTVENEKAETQQKNTNKHTLKTQEPQETEEVEKTQSPESTNKLVLICLFLMFMMCIKLNELFLRIETKEKLNSELTKYKSELTKYNSELTEYNSELTQSNNDLIKSNDDLTNSNLVMKEEIEKLKHERLLLSQSAHNFMSILKIPVESVGTPSLTPSVVTTSQYDNLYLLKAVTTIVPTVLTKTQPMVTPPIVTLTKSEVVPKDCHDTRKGGWIDRGDRLVPGNSWSLRPGEFIRTPDCRFKAMLFVDCTFAIYDTELVNVDPIWSSKTRGNPSSSKTACWVSLDVSDVKFEGDSVIYICGLTMECQLIMRLPVNPGQAAIGAILEPTTGLLQALISNVPNPVPNPILVSSKSQAPSSQPPTSTKPSIVVHRCTGDWTRGKNDRGERFLVGASESLQMNDFIHTPDCRHYAIMQHDGNFVVYEAPQDNNHKGDGKPIWASDTRHIRKPSHAKMVQYKSDWWVFKICPNDSPLSSSSCETIDLRTEPHMRVTALVLHPTVARFPFLTV